MKMKKFLSFAAFALLSSAVAFSLASCGDDNDEENGSDKKGYAAQLEGRWLLTSSRQSTSTTWNDEITSKSLLMEMKFDAGGNVYYKYYDSDNVFAQAQYKVDGDKINLYVGGALQQYYKILSLKNGVLEFSLTKDGKTVIYRYSKMPSTVAEAKKIVIGQWARPKLADYSYLDAYNMEFNKDGHFYYVQKIQTNAEDGFWYSTYKGQTVAYTYTYDYYTLVPDTDDPSSGTIFVYYSGNPNYNYNIPYKCLTSSTIWFWDELMTRAEKELKYVVIDD